MTRDEALTVLGFGPLPWTPPRASEVREAFARQVKRHHPDGRAMTVDMGGQKSMATLKEAREVLLSCAPLPVTDCPACRGSGWVATGFKQERCPRGC